MPKVVATAGSVGGAVVVGLGGGASPLPTERTEMTAVLDTDSDPSLTVTLAA